MSGDGFCMKKRVSLAFLLFLMLCCTASSVHAASGREAWVETREDVFVFRPVLATYSASLELATVGGDRSLVFQPNDAVNLEFGFSLWWLGASISFRLPFTSQDEDVYGKTMIQDFSLSVWTENFGIDLYGRSCQGFWLENGADNGIAAPDGKKYLLYPDLRTTRAGFNMFYVFDERFSFKAALKQSERQRKSAGSWYLEASFDAYGVENSGPIVPVALEPVFGELASNVDIFGVCLALGPGYGYSMVWDSLALTLAGAIEFGWQWRILVDRGTRGESRDDALAVKFDLRIALNWQSGPWFAGLTVTADVVAGGPGTAQALPAMLYSGIYAGLRL